MEKKKNPPTSKTPVSAKPIKQTETSSQAGGFGTFAFGKENYRLMIIGLVLIVAGFLLMIGGGSKDPNQFNPEIFSFRRITLAPVLILAGYVVEIFAIMKKPKD